MVTDVIIGTQIDPETGEVISGELAALHTQARAAADVYVEMSRARMDLADLQRVVDALIAEQFPQLAELRKAEAALTAAYASHQEALREAARAFWMSLPSGAGKTLLGGAVTIAEAQRVTFYDAKVALEWCEEMRPDFIKHEADKKKVETAARIGLVPPGVMKVETVIETRVKEAALAELAGGLK